LIIWDIVIVFLAGLGADYKLKWGRGAEVVYFCGIPWEKHLKSQDGCAPIADYNSNGIHFAYPKY
jgi:hypothetical protein